MERLSGGARTKDGPAEPRERKRMKVSESFESNAKVRVRRRQDLGSGKAKSGSTAPGRAVCKLSGPVPKFSAGRPRGQGGAREDRRHRPGGRRLGSDGLEGAERP